MASPKIQTGGIGGTTGLSLCQLEPLYTSGNIWYVDNSNATAADGASPAGKDRIKPLLTIAQANTNSAAGDIIVMLAGHSQTITSMITLSKAGVRLVSEGSATTRASLICGASIASVIEVTAAGVVLGNIKFGASTTVPTAGRVRIAAATCVVDGCYFDCSAVDTIEALRVDTSGSTLTVRDTSFVSSAATPASQPESGMAVVAAVSDMVLSNVTFNGGSSGWSGAAFDGASAVTRLTATGISLLNDSDFTLATGSVYTVHVLNQSGSARVDLAA